MGVSKNNATPKWMVKIRENPIYIYMGVEPKNRGGKTPNHPFVHRVWNHEINHPKNFGGPMPTSRADDRQLTQISYPSCTSEGDATKKFSRCLSV